VALVPLAPYLPPQRVRDLAATSRRDAILEMCALLEGAREVGDPAALRAAVLEREEVMSTGIGLGIAVPHAKIRSVKDFVLALGRSAAGVDFASLDGRPAHLVVLIAGPEDRQARYLQILASVTLRLKDDVTRRALLEAPTPEAMREIFVRV
jgi:PTS system nitrogen regulatory IIA component